MKYASLLFLLGISLFAQPQNNLVYVNSAPSGSCINAVAMERVIPTGHIYSCISGTWADITGAGGGGSGVTSITVSAPLSGGTITTTGTIGCPSASGSVTGCLTSGDWTTFNGKQAALGFTPLNAASNLSDVANAATSLSNLAGAPLASPTFTGVPAAPTAATGDSTTQLSTDAFVSNALQSINPAVAVEAATTTVLPDTPTYNNGTAGVGATLTAGSAAVLTIDGYTPALNDPLLIKNQASTFQNGVYTVTTLGTVSVPYVLTRRDDYDTVSSINYTGTIPVINGTTNANTGWNLVTQITAVGSPNSITYVQASVATPSGGSVKMQGNATNNDVITGVNAKTIKDSGVSISNIRMRSLGYAFGDAVTGSALTTSEVGYVTVPFACTVVGWHIMLDAGTATVKTWRVNGGTALPTVANSINTSGVSISSGTKVDSTTVTDFTSTAIAVNDTLGFSLSAVSTAKQLTFQLDCQN